MNVVLHGGMPSLHPWKMQMGEGERSGEWYKVTQKRGPTIRQSDSFLTGWWGK